MVWPDGVPQQVHLDLHVTDPVAAHEHATGLGAVVLRAGDLTADEDHTVYADPAGHPFCIGWGHPSEADLAAFVAPGTTGAGDATGLASRQREVTMMIALFFVAALAFLVAIALAIHVVVRRRALTQPGTRPDGLGDDLRLGIGLNLYP